MRRGGGLLWAFKSFQRVTERGARGGAIYSFRELPPKGRREGSGGASASYQKMTEMRAWSGAVVRYVEVRENGRNEGRGGSVVSCRELPGGGQRWG
jgi:hypothetical protein